VLPCTSRLLRIAGGHHLIKEEGSREKAGPLSLIEWPCLTGATALLRAEKPRRRPSSPSSPCLFPSSPSASQVTNFSSCPQRSRSSHSHHQHRTPPLPSAKVKAKAKLPSHTHTHQCVLSSFLFSSSALLSPSCFLYVC